MNQFTQYLLLLALGIMVIVFTLFGIYAYLVGYAGKFGGIHGYYGGMPVKCFAV